MEQQKSGLATAGLVLGIIGVVLSFMPIVNYLAIVLGLLAVIFGIVVLVKKRSTGFGVASLVLGIAAIGITIAVLTATAAVLNKVGEDLQNTSDDLSGNNTQQILEKDLTVTLGEFTVTTDESGFGSSSLKVATKNISSDKHSYTIHVEAVDASGARIAEDTVYANDLNAGQAQDFEAFKLVTSDKYDALKAATFKIVSVTKL